MSGSPEYNLSHSRYFRALAFAQLSLLARNDLGALLEAPAVRKQLFSRPVLSVRLFSWTDEARREPAQAPTPWGHDDCTRQGDHWPVDRKRSMSRLTCEIFVTPISFMSRSISARMLPSALSTPGCPAAASA